MLNFINYSDDHREDCLNLFDENCPEFFAENERADYEKFLSESRSGYWVGISEGIVAAAFGVDVDVKRARARITWIMVSKLSAGKGVGAQMMEQAKENSRDAGVSAIDIAASHLSAPFFKKFGAKIVRETENGWGRGMHRVDMQVNL